jgi:hypothetical protein
MRGTLRLMLALAGLLGAGCGHQPTTTGPTPPAAPSAAPAPSAAAATASVPNPSASAVTTAEPAAATRGDTLFVREKRADCMGEGPMKCLQVRATETAEWTLLYQGIEGFTYEEGNAYELRVARKPNPKAPADGSSLRYQLVEVVSKRKIGAAP